MAEVVRGGKKIATKFPPLWMQDVKFLPTPLSGYELMPLTLRPTGLSSEIDKDRPDYTVYCGGWMSAASTRPAGARQFALVLSMTDNGPMTRSDRVAALQEVKAHLRKILDALEGVCDPARCLGSLRKAYRS